MAARHRADRKTRRVGRVTRHDAAVSRPNVLSLSLSRSRERPTLRYFKYPLTIKNHACLLYPEIALRDSRLFPRFLIE